MKLTISHTQLRLYHVLRQGAGTLLKAIQWAPATSQKMKNSTASPQALHATWQEFLWGSVCQLYYWKRDQVYSWQFLQSPHSFHCSTTKVILFKLLTLGFNWLPRRGSQIYLYCPEMGWPSNTAHLGCQLILKTGWIWGSYYTNGLVLSRSQGTGF